MKQFICKLLLVKELKSKNGVLHFLRFRLVSTPWLKIYIHKICQSDQERHMHDHPWHFASLLLKGAYKEYAAFAPNWDDVQKRIFSAGDLVRHDRSDAHKIEL